MLFMLVVTGVVPSPVSPHASATACGDTFKKWRDNSNSAQSGTNYNAMVACVNGPANSYCKVQVNGRYVHLEATEGKSQVDKLASCAGWYRDGFFNKGSTCSKSKSETNKATCQTGARVRTNYATNYAGPLNSSSSTSTPSTGSTGGGGGGSGSSTTPATTTPTTTATTPTDTTPAEAPKPVKELDPAPNAGAEYKDGKTAYHCGVETNGDDNKAIYTAIDIGCAGKGNAFLDMMFAIIHFLSNGVGLLLIGSLVFAGIQYTTSRDDPQAVASARNRMQGVLISLLLYVFAYALLNYLIPGALLKGTT